MPHSGVVADKSTRASRRLYAGTTTQHVYVGDIIRVLEGPLFPVDCLAEGGQVDKTAVAIKQKIAW